MHPMTNRNTIFSSADAALTLRQMIMGFRLTQLIYVAARLNIADHLQKDPLTVEQLAEISGAHAPSLYRLLRALASVGIFEETDDRRFQVTPLAEPLQSGVSGSLQAMAVLYGGQWCWQAYGDMLYSIMTGKPAFQHVHNELFFEYLNNRPAAGETFNKAMTAFSQQEANAILEAYDFPVASKIVDVGGGHGWLITAILNAETHATGILFDQAHVIGGAKNFIAAAGLEMRCELISGDFFNAVPVGGDVYILKSIIHDWDDEKAITILKNCRTVMANDARLVLIERIVPPGNEPSEAKLFDINMLTVLGGCERTELQYKNLLDAAGLTITNVISAGSPLSIIEAYRCNR
jgi:hypothetical protein